MTNKESKKKKITAKRREQILKAGMDVFSRKGYAAATIPEIAKAAEVAAGTIYLYFPNKRELFIAVIKNFIITTPLLDLIGKLPKENPSVILKNIMLERFDLIKNKVVARLPSLLGEVLRDPELKALWLEQFLKPFLSQIEAGYRIMAASGKARRIEPVVAVRAVGGMFFGFLMLRIIEGDTSPLKHLPQEKVADDMAAFALHGLLAETGKKKSEKDGVL
jgi:AcrR family transcriptional regulator